MFGGERRLTEKRETYFHIKGSKMIRTGEVERSVDTFYIKQDTGKRSYLCSWESFRIALGRGANRRPRSKGVGNGRKTHPSRVPVVSHRLSVQLFGLSLARMRSGHDM